MRAGLLTVVVRKTKRGFWRERLLARRRVAKAYGLEDGAGLSFYEFRPLAGTTVAGEGANAGEMKRIKEWYREGMNAGVGDNKELKGDVALWLRGVWVLLLTYATSLGCIVRLLQPPC